MNSLRILTLIMCLLSLGCHVFSGKSPSDVNQKMNLPKEETPIGATFASIDKNIFQVTCIQCHHPTGTGRRILLDRESLLDSPLELVIPGNPDESGLVLAIERMDSKRMPPEEDGYSALDESEKAAVRKWIENGAKD